MPVATAQGKHPHASNGAAFEGGKIAPRREGRQRAGAAALDLATMP